MQVPACCVLTTVRSDSMTPFGNGVLYETYPFPMGEANTALDLPICMCSLHKVRQ